MYPKTFLAAVLGAAAVGTGVAGAATMHPVLGAKLSGMGEHGVVNFQWTPRRASFAGRST